MHFIAGGIEDLIKTLLKTMCTMSSGGAGCSNW